MCQFGSGAFLPPSPPSFLRSAWERGAAAFLLLLLLSATAVAQPPGTPALDFPPRDRPEFFDEDESPVGLFHTPAVNAAPKEVQVEDPVTYTVRVTAAGPVKRPPRRPKLDAFPGFAEQFYIEPVGDDADRQVDQQTWEFVYRLKPKNTGVTAIPSFPFVCFTPGLLPPERGYQTKRTAEIPLTVKPRQKAAVAEGPQPVTLTSPPPAVLELAPGPAVLRRVTPLPSPALLAVAAAVLLLPPVVCVGWYFAWRRLYPDAARLARRRRSLAAEEALRTLRTLRKRAPADPAAAAAEAVAGYLRQRLDLSAASPTPSEAAGRLATEGFPLPLVERTAGFFRTCDAARFAPEPAAPRDLLDVAESLIVSLEAEPWPSPSS